MRDQDIQAVIGENIRRLRKARDMTQRQLGDSTGVTVQQISRIETGHGTSPRTMERIAGVLGVDTAALMRKEPERVRSEYRCYADGAMLEASWKTVYGEIVKRANDQAIGGIHRDMVDILTDWIKIRNVVATHAGRREEYSFTATQLQEFVYKVITDYITLVMDSATVAEDDDLMSDSQ